MDDAKLNDDAPITEPGQDRLGFGELARHLADVFLRNDLSRGLVVGIEGEWGSGKSSLANLALGMLGKTENAPSIVRFSPWIVGNRSELLRELFLEFDKVLYNSFPAASRHSARTLLRRYANSTSVLAVAGDIAAAAGLPVAGAVSQALKHSASAASNAAAPSLVTLNEGLRQHFQSLPRPVVVFIDDIDRLEPMEAVEVLRLVRAVADFPNVGYLLAYDPGVLATAVTTRTGVPNGHDYIAKIVQATVQVPTPLIFDLQSWFADEIKIVTSAINMTSSASLRLHQTARRWCREYISTPRHLVKVLNSFQLYIIPIADQIDPADGLFVQILRNHNVRLHNWIERYVTMTFAFDTYDEESSWRNAVKQIQKDRESELDNIIDFMDTELMSILRNLREHLPEIRVRDVAGGPQLNENDRRQYARERRLWSAHHFRLYFSLSTPRDSVSENEVSRFLGICDGEPEAAIFRFRQLCERDHPRGGTMAELLLSRILDQQEDMSPEHTVALFRVLGSTGDDFAQVIPMPVGSPPQLRGDLLEVFRMIRQLDEDEGINALNLVFRNYPSSLAWQSSILGDAIEEHGYAGHPAVEVGQRTLTPRQFDIARTEFLKHLKHCNPDKLKGTPYFCSLMYCWSWAGGGEEKREWIESHTSEDADFVDILCRMRSKKVIHGGDGTENRDYLAKETLEMFFGSVKRVSCRLRTMESSLKGVPGQIELYLNVRRLISQLPEIKQS